MEKAAQQPVRTTATATVIQPAAGVINPYLQAFHDQKNMLNPCDRTFYTRIFIATPAAQTHNLIGKSANRIATY